MTNPTSGQDPKWTAYNKTDYCSLKQVLSNFKLFEDSEIFA